MIVGVILLAIIIYWFLVAPNYSRIQRLDPYKKVYIAHRGLHHNQSDAPENTMPAFQKAIQHGYGIELDVQLTKDRQVVVIHDKDLKRLLGCRKLLQDVTYEELKKYTIYDSRETVPLFSEVLQLVSGKVPVIVEIKAGIRDKELCEKTAQFLQKYEGEFCIESFHPMIVFWFRRRYPQWMRGQLSTDYKKDGISKGWYANFFLGGYLLNFLTRPDFLAYKHQYANGWRFRIVSWFAGEQLMAWTVRSQEELERARKKFQCFIFDSFIPKE